ncbi:MAG: transcription antitermination factor NusB [Pseudomonadota bacterium]
MAKPEGFAARRAALDLILAVVNDQQALDEARLPDALGPADRARALRLAGQALRWAGRADRVLGPYLRKRPTPEVHWVLRLAIFELLGDRTAAHGVVNAAVSLAGRGAGGLTNAVLRKVSSEQPDWEALAVPTLPKWLRKTLLAAHGRTVVEAIEAQHAKPVPLDLTLGHSAPGELAKRLGGETLPTGSLRLQNPGAVTRLPGYSEGHWWVQDTAAAVAARVLAPARGEAVLDLCAAPGGKTLQLASAGANVTALDISPDRIARLRENLVRCGMTAEAIVADALDWTPPAPFEAILLDAPCSATGTIRRHPDLPYLRDGSALPSLAKLQTRLLDRAYDVLAPNGRLVFCTCSLLPSEGEDQIAALRDRQPSVRVDHEALAVPGVRSEWIGQEGLRLRPDFWAEEGGMDGFFVTILRKPARAKVKP